MGAKVGVSGMGRLFCCSGFHCRLRHPRRGGVEFRVREQSMKDERNID